MPEISSKVEKVYGTLSSEKDWNKEVTLTSWFGKEPKIDIRDWNQDHTRCGKGVLLTEAEAIELIRVLHEMFPKI